MGGGIARRVVPSAGSLRHGRKANNGRTTTSLTNIDPMSKRAAALNADVLADLALAAARTARTHLKAAEYLLTGEFWPEAYAIAATGFEEVGKAWLAVQEMLPLEELVSRTRMISGAITFGSLAPPT